MLPGLLFSAVEGSVRCGLWLVSVELHMASGEQRAH